MIRARIAHATARRLRLRVPSRKGDAAFFEGVARRLEECAAVEDVTINPRTGSVLVRHRGDLDAVTDHATSRGLFSVERLDGERSPPSDALAAIRDALVRANESLSRASDGAIDLRSVAFVALVGGAGYQLLRGRFLPAGGVMLMQALDLLFGRRVDARE